MVKPRAIIGVLLPFTMSASSVFSISFFVRQVSSYLRTPDYAVLAVFPIDFIGGAIGGVVFGYLADRLGRRPALLASTLTFGLSVAAASAVRSLPELYVAWFLVGFGVNAQNGVYYPVIVELLKRFQGSLGGLVQGLYFIGYMVDAVLYSVVPFWRAYFLMIGAITVAASASILFVPETVTPSAGPRRGLKAFDRGLALMTVGLSAVVVGAFMFSIPLLSLVPSFITTMGLSESWLILLAGLGFIGFVVAGLVSDLVGRPRTAALLSLAGLASSIGLLMFGRGCWGLLVLSASYFSSGYFSFTGVWASETYPAELRATGTNLVFLVGRVVGGFSPTLAALIYPRSLRVGTALISVIANALALVGVLIYMWGARVRVAPKGRS